MSFDCDYTKIPPSGCQTRDDVIKWRHFPRSWPYVQGIHRSPVNSTHKGQWRGVLIFSSIYAWTNGWVSNGDAGGLKRHRAHYDVMLNSWAATKPTNTLGARKSCWFSHFFLTHWGRVTHICVSELAIIGSDNGLSPGRRQAIIWTNVGILLIRPPGTNFNEIIVEIHIISFKNIHLKMSSGKWRPLCLGLNVLIQLCILSYNG